MKCKYCKSENTIKYGKYKEKQWYFCKGCNHKFLDNGNFVRMRTKPQIIVTSLDMYFEGLSVRKIQRQIAKIFQVHISQVSVWKWIIKFSRLAKAYVDKLKPRLSGLWHVDETMINCEGEYKWFWQIIDEKTKFLVATLLSEERTIVEAKELFKKSKEISVIKPDTIVTDGLWAYEDAIKKVFLTWRVPHTTNIRSVGINTRETNNVIERLHGTLKDRLKVMRGLKKFHTAQAILSGWFVYYNFLRPHETLNGITPSEACGLNLKFENSNGWYDLIDRAISENYKEITITKTEFQTIVRKRKIRIRSKETVTYVLKIFNKDGEEIKPEGMKTEFKTYETSLEFVKFYKYLYPNLSFVILEKHTYKKQGLPTGIELKELSKF